MAATIGQAARKSGCSPSTIRYYEEIALLQPVGRTPNGRRSYGWPEISRLTFIRRARDLGLSIEQVRDLLNISDRDRTNCRQTRDLIDVHMDAIRRKQAELAALAAALQRMTNRCDAGCASEAGADCTVFEDVLAHEGKPSAGRPAAARSDDIRGFRGRGRTAL